jgi:hypothetical protein
MLKFTNRTMRQITQANLFPFKINYTRMPLAVLGFLMAVGCLLVITIFGLLTYQIYFLDRAYLGIQVDGVKVGALNRFEVQQLVMAQTNQRLNRRITIVGQEATWVLTAAELGATIDVEKIVDDVFSLGRQGKFSGDLSVQLRAMDQPVVIKPEIHYDTGPTNAFLARLIET